MSLIQVFLLLRALREVIGLPDSPSFHLDPKAVTQASTHTSILIEGLICLFLQEDFSLTTHGCGLPVQLSSHLAYCFKTLKIHRKKALPTLQGHLSKPASPVADCPAYFGESTPAKGPVIPRKYRKVPELMLLSLLLTYNIFTISKVAVLLFFYFCVNTSWPLVNPELKHPSAVRRNLHLLQGNEVTHGCVLSWAAWSKVKSPTAG